MSILSQNWKPIFSFVRKIFLTYLTYLSSLFYLSFFLMPVHFRSDKDRIAVATQGLHSKFDGSKAKHRRFMLSAENHFMTIGWYDTILSFTYPTTSTTSTTIKLCEKPNEVTLPMLQQAAADRNAALSTALAANPQVAADVDKATSDVSAASELMIWLHNSVVDGAIDVLDRYKAQIKGDGPTALWYILLKTQPTALWGIETARTAVNNASLTQFHGDVTAYTNHISGQVRFLTQ